MLLKFLVKLKHILKPDKKLLYNPDTIIIDTTILCNNNCSFCWRRNKPDYLKYILNKYGNQPTMDFKVYKKIIDDCVQYKSVFWLSLCGPMGEPMLNENLEKFTEYAYKKGHFSTIAINTNGLAIDKHNIKKLLNSINEFSISVDSIDIDTYEKIHGNRNLEKVIENIKMLVDYKNKNGAVSDIYVRFTENKFNKGQFQEFKNFFESLGVDYINYTQEHSFAGVNDSLINKDTVKICPMPKSVLNFNFLGELTTCCINWHLEPTFGSIKKSTIKKMWSSEIKKLWNNKKRFESKPCNCCGGLGFEAQHSHKIKLKK